jgi:TonB family protein
MKYCPKCDTRYDEEIIRFCTKDGTPLIPEEEPKFIEMPSEGISDVVEDDPNEITVIRRGRVDAPTPLDDIDFDEPEPAERIVVPTVAEPVPLPGRAVPASYQAPPRKSNTALVVLATIVGTILVLGVGGAIILLLQQGRSPAANANVNINGANSNVDLNTNLNLDTNFNFNSVSNTVNANANANAKTPTPTPKPSATPSPTPSPDETATPMTNTNSRPANTAPTPMSTPRPTSSPPPANRPVNGGVLNGRAINLSVPQYPQAARMMHASGQVTVQVLVDEDGRVTSAKAIAGHPLLRGAAEAAARLSRINPVRIENENDKTTGFLVYNFREN